MLPVSALPARKGTAKESRESPSFGAWGAAASGLPLSGLATIRMLCRTRGDVAEWLKAALC